MTTNDRADDINANYVHTLAARSQDTPISAWAAWHTTQTAARAPHANAWGLRTFTGVCAGCRVLVLVNLHQETRIVNGSLGTVRGVVFGQNSNKFDVPLFVVVEVDKYTGPPFEPFERWTSARELAGAEHNWRKWMPIPAFCARVNKGYTSTRTNIPIVNARAITTWKSQGMSLDKV